MFRKAVIPMNRHNRLCLAACLGVGLASLAWGCSYGEPQVTTQFPTPPAGTKVDPNAPVPKGKPSNTSAGVQVDPVSGRIIGR